MRASHIVGIVILFCTSLALAQEDSAPPSSADESAQQTSVRYVNVPKPATALDTMARRKNQVVVKNYVAVASITGEDGATLSITACEFVAGTEKAYGLALTVSRTDRGPADRHVVSYVDEDELDGIEDALKTISQMQSGTSAGTDFEASYETKGDVRFANVSADGTRMLRVRTTLVLVPSGDILWQSARFRLGRAAEIQQQLAGARQILDRMRTGAAGPAAENK
jgi:hypothetical protein